MPTRSPRSGRLSVTSMGYISSCSRACGVPSQPEFSVELSQATGREEAGDHGSNNGVFGPERDYELGVVPADRAYDDEYRALDTCWGVDCSRHGQIDQSSQSMSSIARCMSNHLIVCYVLCDAAPAVVYYSVRLNKCCHLTV